MEQTECSETSTYKIHMPGNYPEVSIQHSGHGKSLKSRMYVWFVMWQEWGFSLYLTSFAVAMKLL